MGKQKAAVPEHKVDELKAVAVEPVQPEQKDAKPKKAPRVDAKKGKAFTRGQGVHHPVFGTGKVVGVEASDATKICVNFYDDPAKLDEIDNAREVLVADLTAVKFVVRDRVYHKTMGYGNVTNVELVGKKKKVVYVSARFDAQDAKAQAFVFREGIELVQAADVKKPLTADQVLKRSHGLRLMDLVRHNGEEAFITKAYFVKNHSHELQVELKNEVGATVESVPVEALQKVRTDLRFRDVNLFSAFEVKGRTFVKVGNSTAIAAQIRGTKDEPFAMLATSEAKLAKTAKRSFKQGDKVQTFSPVFSNEGSAQAQAQ
jgi:hypothetical protein